MIEILDEEPTARAIPAFEIPGWAAFGVVAGVTGRGGVPPFDLGLASTDATAHVLDRWRALEAAFPEFDGVIVGRQVHGMVVRWHDRVAGWCVVAGTDGHATATRGILLTVSLADCIPVYLVDPVRGAIALLHSGWRGTAGGIVSRGISLLESKGSRPADLVLHCGVGICGACYQVSGEVATACGRPSPGATQLDLRSVIAEQGRRQGIGRVTVSSQCSAHDQGRYFSHRRSAGGDGRMVAFLGLPNVELTPGPS